jgi:hypothetical protein
VPILGDTMELQNAVTEAGEVGDKQQLNQI